MAKSFQILSGPDGPTSVFFAGKLGKGSLLPVGIAVLATAVVAAVLLWKRRK